MQKILNGPDKGADRDTRIRGLCCARIGNGAWCQKLEHPASEAHASSVAPVAGPQPDPDLKFATGKGAWNDSKKGERCGD